MNVATIAGEIITALTSGLTGLISAVPVAIKDAFEAMFLTSTSGGSTTVSVFAVVCLIFGGIALAFGITKWATNAVSRKVGN